MTRDRLGDEILQLPLSRNNAFLTSGPSTDRELKAPYFYPESHEVMFYGELAETGDTIELPDCEYESLLELFRYMYSDEVILSGSNVMRVLYLAKKYIVPSLADKCAEYLQDNLDASNVFGILPQAQKFEEQNLVDQCWEVIDKETEEALKSDEFATIKRSLLEAVVERDTLNIPEIQLFRAINLWATKRCEEQGLSTVGSEKRRILGERIVKGIRFPVMTEQEFASVVLDYKILTPDEAFNMFKYFNSVPDIAVGFPETKRTGLKELFGRRAGGHASGQPGFGWADFERADFGRADFGRAGFRRAGFRRAGFGRARGGRGGGGRAGGRRAGGRADGRIDGWTDEG